MKKSFILLVAVGLISTCAFAQATTDSLFIVTYTTGSAWDNAKAPNEQPYFMDHSANLGKLRKEGLITAGARYGEIRNHLHQSFFIASCQGNYFCGSGSCKQTVYCRGANAERIL